MRAVLVREPIPAEVAALIERRRRLGQDTHDEVWEGVYHMAPAPRLSHSRAQAAVLALLHEHAERAELAAMGPFNLGGPADYRVPDAGLLELGAHGRDDVWLDHALLAVEVLSPDDETFAKLGFYAAHVDELVVVDPGPPCHARCFRPDGAGMVEVDRSDVLDLATELAGRLAR